MVGTNRSGEQADVVLEAAAAQALRRRAGVVLVPAAAPPAAAPIDDTALVGPAAAARADDLLALDAVTRNAGPVRDAAGRLRLLAEWLAAAAAAGRRLPPELAPALLDAGRRHPELRPLIAPVVGPLAAWLAAQRPDWSYAVPGTRGSSTVDGDAAAGAEAWELGSTGRRVAYLRRLRRHDPARGRELVAAAWQTEAPEDRAALLGPLATGLSTDDEPLLERALDDRNRPVREAALGLLARLPDGGYARRMTDLARACLDLRGTGRIAVTPPTECDRSMRRDGIAAKPPRGVGERAWWLEEVLARTSLRVWPEPAPFLGRELSEEWVATVHRGLARAAAAQQHSAWAAALVDAVTADVAAHEHAGDRQLLAALYHALPADDLAARATAALHQGLGGTAAVGIEQVLSMFDRPWPSTVAEAVLAALDERLRGRGPDWRVAAVCELAALGLPADLAPRARTLAHQWHADHYGSAASRAGAPRTGADPGVAVIERFAATLRYRCDMLEELA
jgi:Family of unknown function (DUF5691)